MSTKDVHSTYTLLREVAFCRLFFYEPRLLPFPDRIRILLHIPVHHQLRISSPSNRDEGSVEEVRAEGERIDEGGMGVEGDGDSGD